MDKKLAFLKLICYFCNVNDLVINIYSKSEELPTLLTGNFFHSQEMFRIAEKVSGDTPFMAVASHEGETVGQLLAVTHLSKNFFPPYIYSHAHVHGNGEYATETEAEEIFPLLLHALTKKLRHACLYIEFSELSKKMFAYRHFRRMKYVPIAWQEIHNSLHSMAPERRLSENMLLRIKKIKEKGVETHEARTKDDIHAFHKLLKHYYRLKLRRFTPCEQYFTEISRTENAKIFLTTYHRKAIGGCTLILCEGNAYLWHLASKRKSKAHLRPDLMTVWHAIKYAYENGCRHIYFMDLGLLWRKNPYREFILSFGGKPVAKYRWFRIRPVIINWALKWMYKE